MYTDDAQCIKFSKKIFNEQKGKVLFLKKNWDFLYIFSIIQQRSFLTSLLIEVAVLEARHNIEQLVKVGLGQPQGAVDVQTLAVGVGDVGKQVHQRWRGTP